MATECERACVGAGCPSPSVVRRALSACNVKDLGVVTNMLSAHCGQLRVRRRQELLDQIEERIAMCERMGDALFSERAVGNMLSTADLRQSAKDALQLRQRRRRTDSRKAAFASAARVYPTDDLPGGILAPAQMTVPELFARRFAGDTERGATSIATLDDAAAQLPFYDLAGARSSVCIFSVAFGMPQILGGPGDDNDHRVLLCFIASPPQDEGGDAGPDALPTVGGKSYLVWPPASATVRIGDKIVARRGRAALPVDVTDSLRDMGRLTVTGQRKGVPLLGVKAVTIACHYDSQSASGDVEHFLHTHSVGQRSFVPKAAGNADDVVEFGFYRVPLACPLSMGRIDVPVRAATCNHAQCFDLASLLMAGSTTGVPKWQCPVCSAPATIDGLEIDMTIQHALKSAPRAKFIDLEEGGARWREVTGKGWRDPAKEKAEAAAARSRECLQYWSEKEAVKPAPTPLVSVRGMRGTQDGFATAGTEPADGGAAMAFWMDLSPDEGDEERDSESPVHSYHATDSMCVHCRRVAVADGADYCAFCHLN